MIKQRQRDNAKLRRTLKRGRLGDSVFSGSLVYVKLFFAWALLLMVDFLLGFRFEYLWPFWLLMRSIYDSFRYQGLAFSVFFVCVTVTSDLVCFLFIPVQWLFVLASTYVWLQYVWHAVSLCLLFVCFEASVRLKEIRPGVSLPFTLDLCRPFAAHCIGYPVVTLGFGVKSYVGYKYRMRKQREIARENLVHAQVLTEALPAVYYPPATNLQTDEAIHFANYTEDVISSGNGTVNDTNSSNWSVSNGTGAGASQTGSGVTNRHKASANDNTPNSAFWAQAGTHTKGQSAPVSTAWAWLDSLKCKLLGVASGQSASGIPGQSYNPMTSWLSAGTQNDGDSEDESRAEVDDEDAESSRGSSCATNNTKEKIDVTNQVPISSHNKRASNNKDTNNSSSKRNANATARKSRSAYATNKDNTTYSPATGDGQNNLVETMDKQHSNELELEIEKLKCELRSSRLIEAELRSQVQHLNTLDKGSRTDLTQLKYKNEQLENKLQNLTRSRDSEKQSMQTLEKRLIDEQRQRTQLDAQLEKERKANKRAEEQRERKDAATGGADKKSECGEACRVRRRDLEQDIKMLRRDLRTRDEQINHLDNELSSLRQYKDAHNSEVLMSALATMKEKNQHLEKSLSAENRLKQDLFSALGEAKHEMDAIKMEIQRKNQELECLRHQQMGGAGPTITPPPPPPMSASHSGLMMGHNTGAPAPEHSVDLLTSAIYNGVAAYLNTNTSGSGSGNNNNQVSNAVLGTNSSVFEDALNQSPNGTADFLRQMTSYTPPRTSSQ